MTIKIDKGANRLEQMALDARLERLGVAVDPKSREVREEGAKGSRIKGGQAGLARAAAATGASDVLELSDLPALREKASFNPSQVIARLRGKDDATISKAQLKGTAMTLNGAAMSLERFVRDAKSTGRFELGALSSTLGFINKATQELGEAVKSENLGHASAEDLAAIRTGYSKLMDALGSHAEALETIVNKDYRPAARRVAAQHNAGTSWQRMTNGLPIGTLRDIEQNVEVLSLNVGLLAQAGALFEPHPSDARRLAQGLVKHFEDQGVQTAGPKMVRSIEWTIGKLSENGLSETQAATLVAAVLERYREGSQAPGSSPAGDAMMRQLRVVEASVPGLSRTANLQASVDLLTTYASKAHPGDFDAMLAHLSTPAGATLPAEHPHSIHA